MMARVRYLRWHDISSQISITSIFRTYSVDSSESSSDEGNEDKDVREEVEELTKVLSDLVRENRELEVSSVHNKVKWVIEFVTLGSLGCKTS